MSDAAPASPAVRRRRWPFVLAAVVVVLLAMAYWGSRPSRVATAVLSRVEAALGLEITVGGASEYRLRDRPTLVLREVEVRQPGAATPLLQAKRILLSLPWSTLRARGAERVVHRVELDGPRFDLAAYQAWKATRPTAPTRLPTLTDGLQVADGRILGGNWSIEHVDLDVPSFHPDRPVAAEVSGRYVSGRVAVPFAFRAALTRPSRGAGLGLVGGVEVQAGTWRLPMAAIASGRLHEGDDGLGLDRLRYAADARYVGGSVDEPFALGLAGRLRYRDGRLQLAPLGVGIGGTTLVPSLHAGGRLLLDDELAMALEGTLAQWPRAWPALPEPLGSSVSPLPFELQYRGAPDLSGGTALRLERDGTHFDAAFRLPAVLEWLESRTSGTPLPPLRGKLVAPRLEIAGAQLHGVEIEFEDEPVTESGR
ncbi:hypothetical protein [Lysobacter sp. A3-1-A15]|uniref:hypothetical protein n=1 Tax=Novilysobacter viscosus TaxID=3098602 RepID=UPI002EDB0CAB